ncbi:MAG TPA: hypothetical protein PLD88_10085 [Candidatus Berkiella sp.]|nr:hypothetical protein [Candidatus Berkiella sp.]
MLTIIDVEKLSLQQLKVYRELLAEHFGICLAPRRMNEMLWHAICSISSG